MSLGGKRRPPPPPSRDEAERPFWISFSDLMTALMALFLVAMTVALLSVTHEMAETEDRKAAREEDIDQFMAELAAATRDFPGVTVRGRVVDFGERARFETNRHSLDPEQARLLRELTPSLLALARAPLGEKWLKRVVVEGFADARGSYLYNLHLSLQRSERVLCALLAAPPAPSALSEADRLLVRELFLVSGASFNALRESHEESRRIELRLEFLELDEARLPNRRQSLETETRCPLDAP
ncbi:MAG: flagellar motor protein MotB [Zoogloeaceae bacterium]|jgi:outer membrane protein OmpA-like peptidoglycan-associated protein|nr:flagellar motor protein MotB [Zoogloeaceae bacterium]